MSYTRLTIENFIELGDSQESIITEEPAAVTVGDHIIMFERLMSSMGFAPNCIEDYFGGGWEHENEIEQPAEDEGGESLEGIGTPAEGTFWSNGNCVCHGQQECPDHHHVPQHDQEGDGPGK